MARLPQPGGDAGNWGTILNDYLAQSHQPNGALRNDIVTGATIADGTIAPAQLTTGVQSSLAKADTAVQPADVANKITEAQVATAISNSESAVNSAVIDVVESIVPAGLFPVVDARTNLAVARPAGYAGGVMWLLAAGDSEPINQANGDLYLRVTDTVVAWTPAQLPNVHSWFDAQALSVTDGSAVAQWDDLSGNNHHAKQASAGAQPTFRTGALNTHQSVEFDGVADYLITDAFTASVGEVWTVYAVVQSTPVTLTGGSDFFYGGLSSVPTASRLDAYRTTGSVLTATRGTALAGPSIDNGVHRIKIVYNGASSSITLDNGTPVTGTTSLSGIEVVRLALGSRADGANFLQGHLGEVLFVKGTVSTDDDAKMTTYLQGRWGIS